MKMFNLFGLYVTNITYFRFPSSTNSNTIRAGWPLFILLYDLASEIVYFDPIHYNDVGIR